MQHEIAKTKPSASGSGLGAGVGQAPSTAAKTLQPRLIR
jgi:hypothetical protein